MKIPSIFAWVPAALVVTAVVTGGDYMATQHGFCSTIPSKVACTQRNDYILVYCSLAVILGFATLRMTLICGCFDE